MMILPPQLVDTPIVGWAQPTKSWLFSDKKCKLHIEGRYILHSFLHAELGPVIIKIFVTSIKTAEKKQK